MIVRIVKMQFRPEAVTDFLALFEGKKSLIAGFEGCLHLELWRDTDCADIFFTHSRWQSPMHLLAYRQSALFRQTWAITKTLFAQDPEAWSLEMQYVSP